MPEAELYAVTGKPIGHSLSPELFELLFASVGRRAIYTRLAADSAGEALETARAIGLLGLNVTSPFKEEILSRVDSLAEEATRIGAANCLALHSSGQAYGYNTDFIGFIGALRSSGVSPNGLRALILGTGGAARAAAYGLLQGGAARVVLAGRSVERAKSAARSLGCESARLDDVRRIFGEVEVVISCLPFPGCRVLPESAPKGTLVIDAHYSSWGAPPQDGYRRPSTAMSWLFHQAIPSLKIFTGLDVPESAKQRLWEDFMAFKASRKPHLALVGFMGAGKTTTGRELARLMDREFIDTDDLIEAKTGMSVPTILKRRGEALFRSLEKAAVASLSTAAGAPRVISVGGGAVLDKDNRAALARSCRIVWLWTAARTALSRVDFATRPLLNCDRPLESAERTLEARLSAYASVADLIVSSESRKPFEVARRIRDEMG